MIFRPCVDLHEGVVKQIVGGARWDSSGGPVTNFTATHSPAFYARRYREDGLTGGHVIMLGPGCEPAAREALAAWPGGLQVGGGVTADNARAWLDDGAAAVIVTSYVFREGRIDWDRLKNLSKAVGRSRLVLDLSCRKRDGDYFIVTDRWRTFTETRVEPSTLNALSAYCFEFLIHGVDVEGLCQGIEEDLVRRLGEWSPLPTTYAGGIRNMRDIEMIRELGQRRLDYTVGSALDLFGGSGVRYDDLVAVQRET
ncbi:MAG TPA: phosphoribosylformimino-5-aminoimidazole carboxamide ribotide isomerase [Armatimonadota bacterium]|nr:phosphoribosylformimino-5-aminoimidazole carboxamide ribotide isomerase [Armatimonadota bacterium]